MYTTTEEKDMKYAIVKGTGVSCELVAQYLPSNYEVLGMAPWDDRGRGVLIGGTDSQGWTMDDYIVPRLASGLLFATVLPECFEPDMSKVEAYEPQSSDIDWGEHQRQAHINSLSRFD